MPYALQADVENELKNTDFNSSSSVTDTAVDNFIDEADAIIDMHLQKRYTTPVTTAKALLVVKKIAIDIVVYRIAKILETKKSVPIPDNNLVQEITEGSAYRESMRILQAIRDNKMDLPGETLLSSTSSLQSFHAESSNSDIVPCFNKETTQW